MLETCSVFALQNNVLHNPAKLHCIRFSTNRSIGVQFPVSLQGQLLTWINRITHLGSILNSNSDNAIDICKCLNDYACQVNYFLPIDSKLFYNFCNSLYGCEIWSLSHRLMNEFDTISQ